MKMQISKKDIVILILFSLFMILGVTFLVFINSEGAQCIANPLPYGYNQIKPSPLECSCSLVEGKTLIFDNDSSEIKGWIDIKFP